MSDKKISELVSLTGANAATGDLLPIVDISATETKKITREEFFTNIPSATISGNLTVDTNTLFVDASNNRVGIGTNSPASKFVVSGGRTDLIANSETYALGVRYSSGTGIYYIGASNSATPDLVFSQVGGSERVRFTNDGNVGIGTSSPTNLLDVNADSIRVRTAQTPATAGAAGNQGEIAWDADYIYVCVATNTWKRVAIATW